MTALADFVSQFLTCRIADRGVRVKTVGRWILIRQIDKVRLEVGEQFDISGLVVEVAAGRVRLPASGKRRPRSARFRNRTRKRRCADHPVMLQRIRYRPCDVAQTTAQR
jgi:hypothetical protein